MKSNYAPLALIAIVLAMAIYGATRDRDPAAMTSPGQETAAAGTGGSQVPVRSFATPMPARGGTTAESEGTASEDSASGQSGSGETISAAARPEAPTAAAAGTRSGADEPVQDDPRVSRTDAGETAAEGRVQQAWDTLKEGVKEGVEEIEEVTKEGLDATKRGLKKARAATVDLLTGDERGQ